MVSQMAALQAHPREVMGKKVKTLRSHGITPIHLYGKGADSAALQVETATLRKVLVRVGKNRPVNLKVDGSSDQHVCFVREIQFDPLNEQVQHVDFLRVDITERMEFQVPIHVQGEAPAVKSLGGTLVQVLRAVAIECLPLEVPGFIDVDVTGLTTFNEQIRGRDLKLPANVVLITEPEQVVVHVVAPVKEEVAAPQAAVAEAAAPAEGAAVEGATEEKKE
ncbi:MAG: 50S ribosomal protein L25 [Dehalococcoidia bacterium]|nr:50S ribosomal protein L25 [Dehalococcoidia bacterium]